METKYSNKYDREERMLIEDTTKWCWVDDELASEILNYKSIKKGC